MKPSARSELSGRGSRPLSAHARAASRLQREGKGQGRAELPAAPAHWPQPLPAPLPAGAWLRPPRAAERGDVGRVRRPVAGGAGRWRAAAAAAREAAAAGAGGTRRAARRPGAESGCEGAAGR